MKTHRVLKLIVCLTAIAILIPATVVQAASLPGAIFTTTPDGGIVNENVHYNAKIEVYLDGGPGPNAPQTAAGLPDGQYYFQVTDPSGKVLLSEDPAKCRKVQVTGGVITALLSIGDTYTVGKNTFPCSIQDPPTPPYDPNAITGVAGPSGRHDTNMDIDHGPPAIVVQLMPFFDTPNPGGVYKAWIIPVARYIANGGDPNKVPNPYKVKGVQVGFDRDPGFGPPRDQVKTDNFKVKEVPPKIRVFKFNDLNGNGIKDAGEPEITGWLVWITETLFDGTKVTNSCYTPCIKTVAPDSTVTVEEDLPFNWTLTYVTVDDVYRTPPTKSVDVVFAPGDTEHTVIFGNFKNVDVTACKYDDKTGNGLTDDDTPIQGWTVKLTKNGVVQDAKSTGSDGCYTWTNLGPVPGGYYDVSEVVPAGWTPTSDTSHNFASPPTSGASYSFTFTNFKNVEVQACKYDDKTGNGLTDDDTPIAGWLVSLTKNGVVQDTKPTGENGCYKWLNLGPVPGGKYDVEEETKPWWTPTSATSHDFSPILSHGSYTFTFTNFKNVEVTACKLRDSDGSLATTNDQTPIAGWSVNLTKNGVVQETKQTGENGCYKWTNLGPVVGGYYDVSEVMQSGWIALTPTFYKFETPPRSGATYSFIFINTPTQGCTPGFWQGGNDFGTAGGQWLWNEVNDPQWSASGGAGTNPYIWTTPFNSFFTPYSGLDGFDMMSLVGTGGGSDDFQKAARDLVAAYLNSSWNMAYAYTPAELAQMWTDAVNSGDFMTLHLLLDAANNAPGGCPISASGY